jgi:hypothetical protein
MNRRTDVLLTVARAALLALAVYAVLGAAAVVMGPNGTQTIVDRHVPRVVGEQVQRLWPTTHPTTPVRIEPSSWSQGLESFNPMPPDGGAMPRHWAELDAGFGDRVGRVGELAFWDASLVPRMVWLGAGAAAWLGLAWLWWTLATIAGSARSGDPFHHRNARRLAIAGGLVFAGPALLLAIRQAALWLMLEESSASGKATLWFQWEWLPLWPLGVGLALLVLAVVWRRGVAMRDDLEGLV